MIEEFDNNAESATDKEYITFVTWLTEQTVAELRKVKGHKQLENEVLARYIQRGYRANLSYEELMDFLGVSSSSILDQAGYNEEEGATIMHLTEHLHSPFKEKKQWFR